MAEGGKSGGGIGGLAALVQQWQVVVTAIAALTALWFGFAEQRRKQVEINRSAVQAAKDDRGADFASDPYATLAEFRVSYPEHAFCAALGLFFAEANRAAAGGDVEAVRRMGDAVGAQVERIAGQGGLTLAALEAAAEKAAGDGTAGDACPDLRPGLGLRGQAMWPDCRVLVETYAQALCQARAASARRASVVAEVGGAPAGGRPADWMRLPPDLPPPPPAAEPAPMSEPGPEPGPMPMPTPEPAPAAPGAFAAPGPACGPNPPLLYLQTPGDPAAAEPVAARLRAAGWMVPGVEAVKSGATRGDVRFYWPDQIDCARGLAGTLQAETGREFATVSLAGRYRNLPLDRMEIWLPRD